MTPYKTLLIVALLALLAYSDCRNLPEGRYVFGDSYIDDITLSYENGIWQCDRIVCPLGSYGCRIQRKNDPNNSLQLIRTNICFHENDGIIRSVFTTEAVSARTNVYINVSSYVGAESFFTTGYALIPITHHTLQNVVGVINPDGWAVVQEDVRNNIRDVENKFEETMTVKSRVANHSIIL